MPGRRVSRNRKMNRKHSKRVRRRSVNKSVRSKRRIKSSRLSKRIVRKSLRGGSFLSLSKKKQKQTRAAVEARTPLYQKKITEIFNKKIIDLSTKKKLFIDIATALKGAKIEPETLISKQGMGKLDTQIVEILENFSKFLKSERSKQFTKEGLEKQAAKAVSKIITKIKDYEFARPPLQAKAEAVLPHSQGSMNPVYGSAASGAEQAIYRPVYGSANGSAVATGNEELYGPVYAAGAATTPPVYDAASGPAPHAIYNTASSTP